MTERANSDREDVADLQARLEAYYELLKETPQYQAAQRAKERVAHYIKEHPIQSALIALGAGFVLGLLFSSRKSRER
ncbi:MAG: DUF883 C-terminal domain-containing protein [Chloroherpetonaceae bacterium]|nr:DUF883 C-terminal domain-containing protein [Chloroherpetonaceae bacterium]MDW8436649.1 DUF883 C-terminal domain-containing protein [Chloroherpetonaceae bacterium]